MKLGAFFTTLVLAVATIQTQGASQQQQQDQQQQQEQWQDSSNNQEQEEINTPEPTTKNLGFKEAIASKFPRPTRNVTTMSSSPEPRQEPPTEAPTLPPTPAPTPAPTPPPAPWHPKTIGHDEVKPFPQPDPVTISEKAAVKFKPQIDIVTGCVPYPAVNDAGETSGGLQTSGSPRGGCRGSGHGSQVYGRSTWINGVWAIMYSWYFPKDAPSSKMGHRHDWEHVVVFIDNPDVPEPKILGCSPSWHNGYNKYAPCPANVIDGTSVKVKYEHSWPLNHALETTTKPGAFQDLIMWNQMTDFARRALNDTKFGKANTPMNDWNFLPKVEKAWPFK